MLPVRVVSAARVRRASRLDILSGAIGERLKMRREGRLALRGRGGRFGRGIVVFDVAV